MFRQSGARIAVLLACIPWAHAETTGSVSQAIEPYRQQGASVKYIAPIFSQLVMTAFPQGFKTVFENNRGPRYIREAVLEGEDENKWTQMITITGVKDLSLNANVSPMKFADGMAGGFKRACPNSFSAGGVSEWKIDGREAFTVILSCGTSPSAAGAASEMALITVIKGERDYYTIQWAERGAPSSTPVAIETAKWVERFKRLAPIKICPIVPGEAAPYPSCIGSK